MFLSNGKKKKKGLSILDLEKIWTHHFHPQQEAKNIGGWGMGRKIITLKAVAPEFSQLDLITFVL